MSSVRSNTGLVEAVQAVTGFLVADKSLQDTLDRVATLACQAVLPAVAVGITLVDDLRRPATFVSTAEISSVLDQAQYVANEGPCLDAYRQQQAILTGDTRTVADRWPRFSVTAVQQGVLSALSLPLTAGQETYGAFNLYATGLHAFTEDDSADAQLFATQAAVVLGNARAYWGAYELADGLQAAMQSRAAVEQAKGIIMAAQRCGPDEAFAILAGASQRSNTKLRDLAQRIVAGCDDGLATASTPRPRDLR